MNDRNHDNRVRIGALAVSVAVTMAALIGLTTASEYQGPRADAQVQGHAVAAEAAAAVSLPPNTPIDDPELMRLGCANDHQC